MSHYAQLQARIIELKASQDELVRACEAASTALYGVAGPEYQDDVEAIKLCNTAVNNVKVGE